MYQKNKHTPEEHLHRHSFIITVQESWFKLEVLLV